MPLLAAAARTATLALLSSFLLATADAQPADTLAARVDAVFARADSDDAPGCGVAVLRGDEVVLQKTYGMAHIGFGVPMQPSTSVWIPYSETRVFVALAVAMLARDGRLLLDDAVRRHVPEVPAYAEAVTVRQLLHHTSGLADYGSLVGPPGWEIEDRLSEDEFFRTLSRWGKLGFPPGEGTMYSNTDYALLKILGERVTGGSLHATLAGTVFEPLGMASTRVGADQAAVVPGHALFYDTRDGGLRTLLRYRESPVGGISVTTSLDDLVRWARALRDPASGYSALLTSLEAGAPEGQDGFAFGVYPLDDESPRMVTYRGVGEYLYLVRVPEADLSVVTLCMAYDDMWTFGPAVARLYTRPAPPPDSAATVPDPTAVEEPLPAVDVPLAELERYAGEYRAQGGAPPHARITVVGGGLQLTAPDGRAYPARALGGGLFTFDLVPAGVRIDLLFAPSTTTEGEVTLQILEDGDAYQPPFERWSPWQPTPEDLRAYPGTYTGDDVDMTLYVTMEGDRVVMAGRGMAATVLPPQREADTFRVPNYLVRFHRDEVGRVSHLTLDATRVQGIRFTRQPDP